LSSQETDTFDLGDDVMQGLKARDLQNRFNFASLKLLSWCSEYESKFGMQSRQILMNHPI
jgi:hypothetical protein